MILKLFRKNINKLHTMNSLEGLGWSLVGIYIPIYLKTIGYSWEQVFIYFIIQNTAILFASFVVAYLGRIFSLRRVLLIRFPVLFIFLILLFFIETKNISIYLLALVDGLQSGMFWLPMHILFSRFISKDDIEGETSKLFAIPQFICMFGPLIGGLISSSLNFGFLFGVGFVLFVLAFIPMVMTRIEVTRYDFSMMDGFSLFKKYPKYFFSELLLNIAEEIEGVIWPIFVYINVASIASVGFVGTLLAVSSAVFTLVVGKISNKRNQRTLIITGTIVMMMIWFFRFYLEGELTYYLLTIFSGIAYVLFSIPYYSGIYKIGKKEKTAVFFAFREVPVWMARVVVFCLALVFVENLEVLFLIAGIVYIYFLFWKRSSHDNNN
jgi:MFS family permease